MGTIKGVLREPTVDTGDNDLAGDLVGVVVRKWAGLAGMGTGRWTGMAGLALLPLPPPPLDELLMMLSILNELTRPPPAPLF